MFCELCGGMEEPQDAKIMKDDGEPFTGLLCSDCRAGRTMCLICDAIVPGHANDCPAKS